MLDSHVLLAGTKDGEGREEKERGKERAAFFSIYPSDSVMNMNAMN